MTPSAAASSPGSASLAQTEADYAEAVLRETVDANPYIPVTLTVPQAIFASRWEQEVLYGGAAGGGKTIALLASALQYVQTPGYKALLLRRTYPDLVQPGGLLEVSKEWLSTSDASWNEQQKTWFFPSGAKLVFGYLDIEKDMYRYQGGGYQFVGFDELTQFSERPYRYLFSRLRKTTGLNVPLRMRAGSNPGGVGHTWVFKRFVAPPSSAEERRERRDRLFVPARLDDNPYLDRDAYRETLARLDPVVRRQLELGDWHIADTGGVFSVDDLAWQDQWIEAGQSGRLESVTKRDITNLHEPTK